MIKTYLARQRIAVIFILLLSQLMACQSLSESPEESLLTDATPTLIGQKSPVPASPTQAIAQSTDALESATPEAIPTISPTPKVSTTSLTTVVANNPTVLEQELTFQAAFVVSSEEGTPSIWMYSTETQEATLLIEAEPNTHIGPIIQLRPDKAAIGYTKAEADGTWAIWEVEITTGAVRQLTPFFFSNEYHGFLESWSPDQQWLYIRLLDTTPLQAEHQVTFNLPAQESIEVGGFVLAWSPITPNRFIDAVNENDQLVLKIQDVGGDSFSYPSPKQILPLFARWHPNEPKVITGFFELNESTFFMLDLDTGQFQPVFTGNRDTQITGWSPDGEWVAFNDDETLAFLNSHSLARVVISVPNLNGIIPETWLDSHFLFRSGESLYAANPEQPESVWEVAKLGDIYPDLGTFAPLMVWKP